MNDPAIGLVVYFSGQVAIVFDFAEQAHQKWVRTAVSCQDLVGPDSIADGFASDLEQIFLQSNTLFFAFGVLDADHPFLGAAPMVGKDDLDPEIVSGFGQQTGDHTHCIEQL